VRIGITAIPDRAGGKAPWRLFPARPALVAETDVCAFGTHRQCLAATWKDGKLTALPLLSGGKNSQALWINNHGELGGFSETSVEDPTCASITPYQLLQIEGVL
jgi:hypothetical protein